MKSLFVTTLLALTLSLSAFALNSGGEESTDSVTTERFERKVRRAIDRTVIFPVDQQGKELAGSVDVEFTVNNNGRIEVLGIDASSPELMDYVTRKLRTIKLSSQGDPGRVMRYRFVFRQQQ